MRAPPYDLLKDPVSKHPHIGAFTCKPEGATIQAVTVTQRILILHSLRAGHCSTCCDIIVNRIVKDSLRDCTLIRERQYTKTGVVDRSVSPRRHTAKSSAQCHGVWKWDLWEAIGSSGRSPHDEKEEETASLCLPAAAWGQVRRQPPAKQEGPPTQGLRSPGPAEPWTGGSRPP